jgi:hypothetical protein
MAFQQAGIKVEREREFRELRGAIERAFSAGNAERFLKQLNGAGLKAREFERVLERRVFEKLDPELKASGATAQQLWENLSVSDQAQVREFYLERIEQVSDELREKYRKVFIDRV